MKSNYIYIIISLLLIAALSGASLNKVKTNLISNSYFPIHQDAELVYETSFGETITKYFQEGEFTISSSEADDFKYRQALIIKEDGVYVIETYQFVKIFLFINKEATSLYGKPLLRFPLPLLPGKSFPVKGQVIDAKGVAAWGYGGQTVERGDWKKGRPSPKVSRPAERLEGSTPPCASTSCRGRPATTPWPTFRTGRWTGSTTNWPRGSC